MTKQESSVVREPKFRRDMNEMLLYREGQPEHSKFWSNVGYCIVAYWMIALPELVWKEWIASAVIASLLITPDIARKIINLKFGNNKSTMPEKK